MGTTIIVVIDVSSPDHKEEKMENDLSLRLVLERPEHMSASDFARTAVGMARSLRERDGLLVAHIEEPSEDLLKKLRRMERQVSHFSCPVGRSVFFPLIDPHTIAVGFWRNSDGECCLGWRPHRVGIADDTGANGANIVRQNWEGA